MPDERTRPAARKRALPPTYLLGSIVAMIALHFLLPWRRVIPHPWRLLGIAGVLVGIVLALVADRAFKRHRTTVKPFEESTSLVTTGAYAISRHPMYLGFVLLLGGIAVLLGSLTPLLVVGVFAVLMERMFIRVEERMMEAQFGQAWLAYKAKVRRWI